MCFVLLPLPFSFVLQIKNENITCIRILKLLLSLRNPSNSVLTFSLLNYLLTGETKILGSCFNFFSKITTLKKC